MELVEGALEGLEYNDLVESLDQELVSTLFNDNILQEMMDNETFYVDNNLRCLGLMSSGTVMIVEDYQEDDQEGCLPNNDVQLKENTKPVNRKKKSYVCPYPDCDKRYTKSSHLKAHQRLHTGERPYKCPHCDHSCVRSGEIQNFQDKTSTLFV